MTRNLIARLKAPRRRLSLWWYHCALWADLSLCCWQAPPVANGIAPRVALNWSRPLHGTNQSRRASLLFAYKRKINTFEACQYVFNGFWHSFTSFVPTLTDYTRFDHLKFALFDCFSPSVSGFIWWTFNDELRKAGLFCSNDWGFKNLWWSLKWVIFSITAKSTATPAHRWRNVFSNNSLYAIHRPVHNEALQ